MAITAGGLMAASAVGALISGASSFASNSANSARSYKQNAGLMGLQALLQYQYQRQLNRNAYQDATYSMRQAGINPMLAINNGASGGSSSVGLAGTSPGNPSSIDMDLLNAYSTAKQIANDTKRVQNETNTSNSVVDKNNADTSLAKAQEVSTQLNNDYQKVQNQYAEKIAKQNLINSVKQGQLIDAQKADYSNQIINRNKTTNSAVSLNQSTAKYNDERSRGFTSSGLVKLGPLSFGINHTGNSALQNENAAKYTEEVINGRKVKVRNF